MEYNPTQESDYQRRERLWKIKYKKIQKREKAEREELRKSIDVFVWLDRFIKAQKGKMGLPKRINKTTYYCKMRDTVYLWVRGINMSEISRKQHRTKTRVQQIIHRFWYYVKERKRIEKGLIK